MLNLILPILLLFIASAQEIDEYKVPAQINMTEMGCSYIETFRFNFAYKLVSVKGLYKNGVFQLTGFKLADDTNKLHAADIQLDVWRYSLQSMELHTPAINDIIVPQDRPSQNTLELQLKFQQVPDDSVDLEQGLRNAIVSVFFSDGQSDEQYHLPDGIPLLLPFSMIDPTSDSNSNVELNLMTMLHLIYYEFHQYVAFKDTTKTTRYFNKQKFYVPTEFIQSFLNDDVKANTGLAMSGTSITPESLNIVKICYGDTPETILRENYALWFWVIFLIVWWVTLICSDTDTDACFMDDYRDNKLSMIPIYSIWVLNNDAFFSKLSRQSNYLVYFSWQILIISVLFGQFNVEKKYNVGDAIILWYALVAMILAWPVGYFFGYIQYSCRQLNKHRMLVESDWKKITNKHSHEAEVLLKAVREDEDRVYTYWFVYYGLIFLSFWACCLISIWQMKFVGRDYSDYWVATIFVLLFVDYLILDTVLAFIPGAKHLLKYRGFYYDGELAEIWKHLEDA